MISEERQKENHENYGNNYLTWKMTSEDLFIAANCLAINRISCDWKKLSVGDVMPEALRTLSAELLLKGSSLECLLKALYLKKGFGKLIKAGTYKKINNVGEHNLLDLVDHLKISFSKEERFLLNRLTLFTKMGRYPVPKNWADIKIQNLPFGGKGGKSFWDESKDDELYCIIRNKILKELDL